MQLLIRTFDVYKKRGITYPYDFKEINSVTYPLGIPWETTKDVCFSSVIIFTSFEWYLNTKRVSLPDPKKTKYLRVIAEWHQWPMHTLEDTRKLYGKLLYTCHVIPQGRAYLTNFKKLMGTYHEHPFTLRHLLKSLEEDLMWWQQILTHPFLFHNIAGHQLIINVRGFSDASSSTGLGIVISDKW